MKRRYVAFVLLTLAGITTTANATDCRVNNGPWIVVGDGGTINLQVPVAVQLSADRARIVLEGVRIECRFSFFPSSQPWYTDYWNTSASVGPAWVPGPKFAGQGTGLRINGTHHDTPVPNNIRINSMPNNRLGVPVDVVPYILVRNNPTNPIDVRIGDVLGRLNLLQTNNYSGGSSRLALTYTAANNFSISPSTCTINNNVPIEVNFGTVVQRAIGTNPLTSPITSNRRLTYSCPDGGITTPITITYKGTPSSFDSRLLSMTNADVGTAMIRGGAAVPVNGRFLTQITNSTGGDDVTFSLARRNGSLPAAGAVSGSGVLVMGVP